MKKNDKTDGNKQGNAHLVKKSGGDTARRSGRAAKAAFDPEAVLAGATVKTVSISDISRDEGRFSFRDAVEPCDPGTFVPASGVVDAATGHMIVLLAGAEGGKHHVLNGSRRLAGMAENRNVKAVKCPVLEGVSDAVATIIAARANLAHGQMLSPSEKRTCFLREMEARRKAGYALPNNCELARAYVVARNTVKGWLKSPRSRSRSARSASGKKGAGQKNGRRKRVPNNDAILADLVAVTRLLADNVGTTPLSNEQAAELKQAIAGLQQLLAPPNQTGEAA